MPLQEIAAAIGLPRSPRWQGVAICGVALDSRQVQVGDLYAALPGGRTHGARFIPDAIAAGAAAVLADEVSAAAVLADDASAAVVPMLVSADPRAVLGEIAARVYGHPSRDMCLVGVTGTNGKTTVSYLVEAGLRHAGYNTALLGTIETRLGDDVLPAVRTTPEAPDLQSLLAVARERGVGGAVMEVSSHALAMHRVDGTHFSAAVFTNLSQDHLDFHGDMERYFAAKALLFRPDRAQTAVLCVDDPSGRRLMELVRIPQVTYSAVGHPQADWRALNVISDVDGSMFRACGPAGEDLTVRLNLAGEFNAANALGALAALVAVGVDADTAAAGLASVVRVPGRLEPVVAGQPFTALVDYAHTPVAVATLLAALRPLTKGRLVVVLGCGGDRDRAKRPLMARAAVAGADLAVFTTDNPRSEDPGTILAEMSAGLVGGYVVEPDRAIAISVAVGGLGPGDTVVVAGKGHESGQEIAGTMLPFDDREMLRAAIVAAGASC